ncbi:hypothetical protein [Nostoc sp.]
MTVEQCKSESELRKDLQSLIDKLQSIVDSPEYENLAHEKHYWNTCYGIFNVLQSAKSQMKELHGAVSCLHT